MSKCFGCGSCREDSKKKAKKKVPPPEMLCDVAARPLLDLSEDSEEFAVLVDAPLPQPLPVHVAPPTARLVVRVRCGATDIDGADVIVGRNAQPPRPAVPTGNDGRADCGQLLAGPWEVTVRVTATNHNDEHYVAAAAPTIVNMVAGVDQNVDVDVDPVVRLKLGQELQNVAAQTWLRVWLPVAVGSGGLANGAGHCMFLSFDLPAGQLSYHGDAPHNAQVAVYDAGNPRRDHSAAAGGWHYFQVLGGAASITVWLWEQGFAREDAQYDSPAVIPWNFYFWSNSRLMSAAVNTPVAFLASNNVGNASVRSPFEDFDICFALGTDSFDWESDPAHDGHNDLALAQPNPKTWEGHCNWMCAASIIFEAPVDFVPFDSEDLKLLASEYAANNVFSESLWAVDDVVIPFAQQVLNLRFANAVVNYPLALLDPAHALPANRAAWRGEDAVAMAPALSTLSSTFFSTTRRRIGELGQVMNADLRASYDPTPIAPGATLDQIRDGLKAIRDLSPQVWNQAIFFYEACYAEHPDSGTHATELRSAQDLRVWLTFYANSDGVLPTNHAPATYQNNDIVVEPNNWSRRARMRLQFTAGGDFNPNAAENTWEACTSIDGAAHYFLPRTLDRITGIRPVPVDGGGNPYVTRVRLEALGLVLRNINA